MKKEAKEKKNELCSGSYCSHNMIRATVSKKVQKMDMQNTHRK
jgi:hypothetical protein